MDHAAVRRSIRLNLHSGRLPRMQAVDICVLASRGDTCDGCGESIGANGDVVSVWSVATRHWVPIYFHEICLQIWDAERIALDQARMA